MVFTIAKAVGNPTVERFPGVTSIPEDADVYIVRDEGDLATVPMEKLIEVYNDGARKGEGREVQRFSDRTAAHRRTWPVIDYLAKETTVATKSKRTTARKTTTTARKGTGEAGTYRPRGAYVGKVITKIAEKNPRKEGTQGFDDWKLIRDGMTYEDYIAKGGRRAHLDWNVAHGWLKLS